MTGGEVPFRDPILTVSRLVSTRWERFFRFVGDMAMTGARAAITGTHAERLGYDRTRVPEGGIFVESDRKVYYQLQVKGTAPALSYVWVWIGGEMTGTITPDQRPADLGTYDAGFLFRATDDYKPRYRWSGSAWELVDGVGRGKLADLPVTLTANDAGFTYTVVDYAHKLRWTGTGWSFDDAPGGQIELRAINPITHVGTVDIVGPVMTWKTGAQFDVSWGTPRIFVSGAWRVVASVDSATQITLAAAPGDAVGAAYALCIGWALCDGNGDDGNLGTAIMYLQSNGTIAPMVIPDLTAGVYLKAGGAAAISPKVVPNITVDAGGGSTNVSAGLNSASATGHIHTASATLPGDPVDNYGASPWFRK